MTVDTIFVIGSGVAVFVTLIVTTSMIKDQAKIIKRATSRIDSLYARLRRLSNCNHRQFLIITDLRKQIDDLKQAKQTEEDNNG